ncbi:MAG: lecithin retinol acyltransferase family protein [Acutalibacteraceae bacterium]|jgi:phosphopantetheinyl transferase
MKWVAAQCKPGDMIRVGLGALHHYGIFVSEERVIQFGLPPLPENRIPWDQVRVLATDIDAFACGRIVEVARLNRREAAGAYPAAEIVRRAESRMGEGGYNLIHNNCEHFATACVFGVARCEQEEQARRRWNQRPVLDVYLARADRAVLTGEVYPPERAREIASCGSEQLRQNKRSDWQALFVGLKKSLALAPETLSFEKTGTGKWICDKAAFSLTHSGDWVAAAVSNRPVGVDLEGIDAFLRRLKTDPDRLAGLRSKTYTPRERRLAPATPEDFLWRWIRKEAAFKCAGVGQFRPRRIDADDERTACWRLPDPVGGLIAVSGEAVARTRFFLLGEEGAAPLTAVPAESPDSFSLISREDV